MQKTHSGPKLGLQEFSQETIFPGIFFPFFFLALESKEMLSALRFPSVNVLLLLIK